MTLVQTEPKKIYMAKEEVVSDMQGPCDADFHVPLTSEWVAVYNAGVNLGAWSYDNTNIISYLKLPKAGWRQRTDGSVYAQGSSGDYWTCSRKSASHSYTFSIAGSNVTADSSAQVSKGTTIRAFKDEPTTPDSSWTTIFQGTGTAGIYYSSSLGLISISSDGATWITIQDKNVGATTVYNSGNTMSEANCGKYYQRGNNYGFPWTGSITTSSTLVNAQNYGPGNYYSSSTFITVSSSPYDRSSVENDNLRGGVTQGTGTVTVDKEITSVRLGETKVRPAYKPRTFTITRTEKSDMSSGWTYSDDAAGLTAGDGAFDDFFGYYGCRLSNAGVESAKIEQTTPGILDITQLGTLTSGDNVMIAFPLRGIKMSKSGNYVTLSITENPDAEGYQYYAFQNTGDIDNPGTAKDVLYLGAYLGSLSSTTMKSWSGKSPAKNTSYSNLGMYCRNGGTGFDMMCYYQKMYIDALYMMKYGTPYTSTIFGYGITSDTTTGGTNSQTNATYGTANGYTQMKLFGLEDRIGNGNTYLGGTYINNSGDLRVALSSNGTLKSTGDVAYNLNSSYYTKSIYGNNKSMFFPMNVDGNTYNTYYRASSYFHSAYYLYNFGYYGFISGLFSGDGSAASNIQSRLMYL